MTSGCIEYWFMLHFKDCAPPTQTEADKNNLVKDVKKFISIYKKGDKDSIWQIAPNYPTAVKYAKSGCKTFRRFLVLKIQMNEINGFANIA